MKLCNGVDENFQHYFVINVGYWLHHRNLYHEEYYSYKSIHNNRDIFYNEILLIFFVSTIVKPIGVARIFNWGPKSPITCNDVIRNLQKRNFLWGK